MTLHLDLCTHCIETEIKRVYNRALSAYFKTDPDREALEKSLRLTTTALQRFDFQHLRHAYPELQGDVAADVSLRWDDTGQVVVVLGERTIRPGDR
jgi:hypothetical protein